MEALEAREDRGRGTSSNQDLTEEDTIVTKTNIAGQVVICSKSIFRRATDILPYPKYAIYPLYIKCQAISYSKKTKQKYKIKKAAKSIKK